MDVGELMRLCGIGEPIVEPEVDLSNFLERQRLADDTDLPTIPGASKDNKDDEDVDTTLTHISSYPSHLNPQATSKKGKLEQIIWDEEIDRMNRDKKAAEATWGMITSIFLPIKFFLTKSCQILLQISKPASEPNQRKSVLHLLPASQPHLHGLVNKVRYLTALLFMLALPAHIVMNTILRLSRRSRPSLTRRCPAKGPDAGNGRFSGRSANLTDAVE